MRDYLEELLRGLPLPQEEDEWAGLDWTSPAHPLRRARESQRQEREGPLQDGQERAQARTERQDGADDHVTNREMKRDSGAVGRSTGPEENAAQTLEIGRADLLPPVGAGGRDSLAGGGMDTENMAARRAAQGAWSGEESAGESGENLEESAALKAALDRTRLERAAPGGEQAEGDAGTQTHVGLAVRGKGAGETPENYMGGGAQSLAAEWQSWDRAARFASSMPQRTARAWEDGGLAARSRAAGGTAGWYTERVQPDVRAVDRAFQRDARRYDGAFPLY